MLKIAKYELREVIGHGGMGIVYRAYDTIMDREVAVKVIQEKTLLAPELKARFIREARMAGKLSHENVTTIHDLGEVDGKTFIVMEYLGGIDLRSVIDRKEPLPLRTRIDYAAQILRGLHYAHENGIVHRDIKPENVKIQPDGRVKIMDFGIAKPLLSSAASAMADGEPALTTASMRIGTPWYMSPEQIQGLAVDRRSDIFSFGVVLYELLTYNRPFDGDDTTVLYRIVHTDPAPIRIEDDTLREDMQRILSRCLAKNPDDRYADCGQVVRDLLAAPSGWAHTSDPGSAGPLGGVFPSDLEGTTISHFRILEKIGTGGMGVVHKAEDLVLRRTVALKFLLQEGMLTDEAKRRFLKEAQAASALDHPNICTIHEVGETPGGLLFICMTYYPGDNLGNLILDRLLGIPEALDIVLRVARGLAAAHAHGIVHRDIKPANVILTTGGEVKIVDFGLAKLAGTTRVTRVGSALGTLPYMSPEQIRGEELDHRSDIWSLGVLLYHLLTGKLPFEGAYEAALFFAILNQQPAPPSSLRPGLPQPLDGIIARALQKNAADRYPDMNAFLADLEGGSLRGQSPQKLAGRKRAAALAAEGKHLLERGKAVEAREVLETAAGLDPTLPGARELIAQADEAISRKEQLEKLLLDAEFSLRRRRFDEASDMYRKALEMDPAGKEALTGLRRVEKERGRKFREDLKRTPAPRRSVHRRPVALAVLLAGLLVAGGAAWIFLRSAGTDRHPDVAQLAKPPRESREEVRPSQGPEQRTVTVPEPSSPAAGTPQHAQKPDGRRSLQGSGSPEKPARTTRESPPQGTKPPPAEPTEARPPETREPGASQPGSSLAEALPPAPAPPKSESPTAGSNPPKSAAATHAETVSPPPVPDTHAGESAIKGMLAAYKQSIEQGNVDGLTALLGLTSDRAAPWSDFFSVSENRSVTIGDPSIAIFGDSARVSFPVRIAYFNSTTNQADSRQNVRVWTLSAKSGAWKVVTQK